MRLLNAALFVSMFLLVSHWNGDLQGYLDPGTASIALQLLLGGVVAVLATVRLYWGRLRGIVTRKPAEAEAETPVRRTL